MRESRRTMACQIPDSPALFSDVSGAKSPTQDPAPTAPTGSASRALGSVAVAPGPKRENAEEPADVSKAAPAGSSRRRRSLTETAPPASVGGGPDLAIETARLARGDRLVAGVDEAGRGPLAGPVVAAAVILDAARLPVGLDDSKKLTAAERERLFLEIIASASVSVASASALEIDRWNIRQATLLAMTRALEGLAYAPCHALVDGLDVPRSWAARGTAVVEGDARALSIAAASIVAKVARDRMMRRLCAAFPAYGFSRHMGYATSEHRLALERHGPCPFHRMTFSPIRQGRLAFV